MDAHLWDDPVKAQKLLSERTYLTNTIDKIKQMELVLQNTYDMIEMAESEGEEELLSEAEKQFESMNHDFEKVELESLLSQEGDQNDAFIEIHSGAGGTESQDWASMLLRMYERWAEKSGYRVELLEESEGEEAGIKSATLKIIGTNAYGWLKFESGVHRLVRISPFDANARRHTSFSSVWVYPVVDDSIEIDINPADCRIDVYRASGAGGQHVNRTESAVRITHIPTGIVAACQTQRSQIQNREYAWNMLRARLYERELQKRLESQGQVNAQKGDNGWGNQIRSYVLQPYQMVKDLRTNCETSDTQGVLDGDLDDFMRSALAELGKGKNAK